MATQAPEWFSTYGLLTAKRLLERFDISLSPDEMNASLKDETSDYHYLLAVPLKNVYNGIVMGQVSDYQVYAQKLLIDYKLASKPPKLEEGEEATQTNIEESVDIKIEDLKALGEELKALKESHFACIAGSQAYLIDASRNQTTFKTSGEVLQFNDTVEQNMLGFKNLRISFRELILSLTEILSIMSDYFLDPVKLKAHQADLTFPADLADVELFDPKT